MEPIISLKRSYPLSFDLCIICQSKSVKDILWISRDQGVKVGSLLLFRFMHFEVVRFHNQRSIG